MQIENLMITFMFYKDPEISTLRLFTQSTITCSKLTMETLEHGVKYVQS